MQPSWHFPAKNSSVLLEKIDCLTTWQMAESTQPMFSGSSARKFPLPHSLKGSKKSTGTTPETATSDEGKEKKSGVTEPTETVRKSAMDFYHQHEATAYRFWQSRWDAAPEVWKHFVSKYPKVFGLSEKEEETIRRKNATFVETPSLTACGRLGTCVIVGVVGAFSKVLMKSLNKLHSYNMETLFEAIESREDSRGLLTVSNHQSVCDDPFLMAAILPGRILLNPGIMRWGLCSLDICFQNSLVSRTLRLGKALPIQRRGGLGQDFLRTAAEKLSAGDWIHVFPEGRVRQTGMGYAKRGVGKVLAMVYEERKGLPLILPMYHEGAEHVMPQKAESNELQSMIPKIGQKLFVMTGEPVDVGHIFDRFMPACEAAGGTAEDPAPCLRLYEEVSDFLAITIRLLRAELRQRAPREHNVDLGDPYEFS